MKDTAIRTLELLARGVHPVTGEILSEESPFNAPIVIRTLYYALGRIQMQAPDRSSNKQRPWSDDETQFVINAFREGASIAPIAKTLKRTRGAVRAELIRHGLISDVRVNAD